MKFKLDLLRAQSTQVSPYKEDNIQIQNTTVQTNINKMNCELMLTYHTPALRQTESRNLTGEKCFPRYGVPI
jgi:hypothetical protein